MYLHGTSLTHATSTRLCPQRFRNTAGTRRSRALHTFCHASTHTWRHEYTIDNTERISLSPSLPLRNLPHRCTCRNDSARVCRASAAHAHRRRYPFNCPMDCKHGGCERRVDARDMTHEARRSARPHWRVRHYP